MIKEDLDDFAEVRVGWTVPLVGQSLLQVFPDPRLADSDVDGLLDDVEKGFRTDPRRRDTDEDGISDTVEVNGYRVGRVIKDGGNGIADTTAQGDDIQILRRGARIRADAVIVVPGPNGVLDSVPAGDDQRQDGKVVRTDPIDPDTDGDLLPDGLERALGSDPTNAGDAGGIADSDEDGLTDPTEVAFGSDPSVGDTDGDGLPDLVEFDIGTDPRVRDADGDGLDDYDEFDDFDFYLPLNLLFAGFELDDTESLAVGTDPRVADTDGDTLTDGFEVLVGWQVLAFGDDEARDVFPNPLRIDTDIDGLTDAEELAKKTDPGDPDTDGDGRRDGIEVFPSDPLEPDIVVTVTYEVLRLTDSDPLGDGGNGLADWEWSFDLQTPGGSMQPLSRTFGCQFGTPVQWWDLQLAPTLPTNIFGGRVIGNGISQRFRMRPGEAFILDGLVVETGACVANVRDVRCLQTQNDEDEMDVLGTVRFECVGAGARNGRDCTNPDRTANLAFCKNQGVCLPGLCLAVGSPAVRTCVGGLDAGNACIDSADCRPACSGGAFPGAFCTADVFCGFSDAQCKRFNPCHPASYAMSFAESFTFDQLEGGPRVLTETVILSNQQFLENANTTGDVCEGQVDIKISIE